MRIRQKLAFLGGGNMTESLLGGLLAGGLVEPEQCVATDIRADRRARLQERFKVRVGAENAEAAGWGEVVVLSVEPQVLDDVLVEIAGSLKKKPLLVSVAAGYPIARVAEQVKPKVRTPRIVRAMPNTPSGVQAGVSAITVGPDVPEAERTLSRAIFESVGTVVEVEERLMDAVTGLSGSGPAYVYVMIEALADGGVKMGLPRQIAEQLAVQTVLGAARMVSESGEHPARLKDGVASPGGTTIAGLHKLEEGRFRATLMAAVEAAARRSAELGFEKGR
jgi:pyrroline-5-carboxylate reductase